MTHNELFTAAKSFLKPGLSKDRISQVEDALSIVLDTGYQSIVDDVDNAVNVKGKRLLEVGSGACWYAPLFLVKDAASYTGVDLFTSLETREILDRHFALELRTPQTLRQMPLSFSEYIQCFSNIEAIQDDILSVHYQSSSFDAAFLLTVSEHLVDVKATLQKLHDLLVVGGKLYLTHGNYYCWNGHHLAPRNVGAFNPNKSEMREVADWGHVKKFIKNNVDGPHVNFIRLHELMKTIKDLYQIDWWKFYESPDERGGTRLTENLRAEFPEYYREELLTEMAYCTCTKVTEKNLSHPDSTNEPFGHKTAIIINWYNHESGFCYITGIPSLGKLSELVLLEEFQEIGPAESLHEDIRKIGKGRYSIWGNYLYFSASDNSDPRENGRTYLLLDRRILHESALHPIFHTSVPQLTIFRWLGNFLSKISMKLSPKNQ